MNDFEHQLSVHDSFIVMFVVNLYCDSKQITHNAVRIILISYFFYLKKKTQNLPIHLKYM